MIGIIPYAGTSFSTYEMLKRHWAEKAREEGLNPTEPKPLQRLMFGGMYILIKFDITIKLSKARESSM